jgi:hypothetical protein
MSSAGRSEAEAHWRTADEPLERRAHLRVVPDTERRQRPAAWGRIGGLQTRARYSGAQMTMPARVGFRRRFEREVDPRSQLRPSERARRADAALRAHMLRLAQRSAEARAARRSDP